MADASETQKPEETVNETADAAEAPAADAPAEDTEAMQTSEEPAAESAPPVSEDVQKLVEHERDATEAAPKKTPRVVAKSPDAGIPRPNCRSHSTSRIIAIGQRASPKSCRVALCLPPQK